MTSYNGFTDAQRNRGGYIIDKAVREGKVPPATRCCRCGQTEGFIIYHVEDYTPERILGNLEPLCWRCHDMIHRVSRPQAKKDDYWAKVAQGWQAPPVGKPKDWFKKPKRRED